MFWGISNTRPWNDTTKPWWYIQSTDGTDTTPQCFPLPDISLNTHEWKIHMYSFQLYPVTQLIQEKYPDMQLIQAAMRNTSIPA